MHNSILKYWYTLEFFNPCWPVDTSKDLDLNKIDLPWYKEQNNEKIRLSYDVYVGKMKTMDLIKWMLFNTNVQEEDRIEPDNSLTCIFAVKIDEKGFYVPDSFKISSFVWAISKIVSSGSIDAKLEPCEVESFESMIDRYIRKEKLNNSATFSKFDFKTILSLIIEKLMLTTEIIDSSIWAKKFIYYAKRDGSFPEIEAKTEMFQSFYLKDLLTVIKNPSDRISEYIAAGNKTLNNRIMIDSNVQEMKKWVECDKFPLGVWPSKYSPSLMQQIGINICSSGKKEIFSINGPPGTGKTTLLKEIIVSNIVERAKLLSEFLNPDDAFKPQEFKNPCDQFNLLYYSLDERLTQYGVLVASNNNSAVENISLELPKMISKDRTGRFTNSELVRYQDIYFSDVASKLIGESAWGLISAKLGKKENLNKLKNRLWWSKDEITLKHHYNNTCVDWCDVCESFNNALQQVINERQKIRKYQSLLKERSTYSNTLDGLRNELNVIKTKLQNTENLQKREDSQLKKFSEELNVLDERINLIVSNLSIILRVFKNVIKNNLLINEWDQLKEEREKLIIDIFHQKEKCYVINKDIDNICTDLETVQTKVDELNKVISDIDNSIELAKKVFGNNWADENYWVNITYNEKSQIACPWTYEEYDKLREELFYQALQVHKAFVLTSSCVKQNLQRLFALWDGRLSVEDKEKSYGELLNTLMLVIPVISTTFASVETFLSGIKENELGLLVIDEAGQATPQSALGALWRTKRAIVVGDPLQVEPITTVPKELAKRFADDNNIPPYYRLSELSVQMLADKMNIYGGYRSVNNTRLWLGSPLVVHRRCISPMFEISNKVAYENKMILKTNEPDVNISFLFEKSIWFDVKGRENGNKDHTVEKQIQFIKKELIESFDEKNELPDVFIISPFKSVARNASTMLRALLNSYDFVDSNEIDEWVKSRCGTIHTFQGKEANEVILVLGCDNQTGKTAAQWVGRSPNIINVAVSRAKYRIAVIGDSDLWKDIPNVNVLYNYLNS